MRRLSVGLSQEKLGAALGLTFQQVQKYEKGINRIGASRLMQIAGILDVSIDFFFEGLPNAATRASAVDTPMLEFLSLPESERLMRSFVRLKDGPARGKVVDLVEWLAAACNGTQARSKRVTAEPR